MRGRIDWQAIGLVMFIISIYLLAGLIDPCDGHSCDEEVTDVR